MKEGISFYKFLLFVLIPYALSCTVSGPGAGGGGGVVGTPDTPILYSITMNPRTAPANSHPTIHFSFTFFDSGGNLNGGSLTYRREGTEHSIPLPDTLAGITGGASPQSVFATVYMTAQAGTVYFQFFLTDNAKNRSNFLTVAFTQT